MPKTALITGTSSGLGKTAARHFASEGWNVVATMRTPSAGTELCDIDGVLVARLDVQNSESLDRAIEARIHRFGRIDVLMNNAGFGPFEATTKEKIREQFDVNVFGVMDVTRAILAHFQGNGGGTIINISSGAGAFTLPMLSLYCASKFALEGSSESLSYELASQHITVKLVKPGGVISTNFGKRSGSEAAVNPVLADYDPFTSRVIEIFAGLRASRTATEADVSRVILGAATDGTDRLRYVATEDIQPLAKARLGTSEEKYLAFMRSQFLPKP